MFVFLPSVFAYKKLKIYYGNKKYITVAAIEALWKYLNNLFPQL